MPQGSFYINFFAPKKLSASLKKTPFLKNLLKCYSSPRLIEDEKSPLAIRKTFWELNGVSSSLMYISFFFFRLLNIREKKFCRIFSTTPPQ